MEVTYTSRHDEEYAKGLKACKTKDRLREYVEHWRAFAVDAYTVVWSSEFNWAEYKRGAALEWAGKYAGDEWAAKYGAITMPAVLFYVSLIASQFGVPWGLAFIRCQDAARIRMVEGVYRVVLEAEESKD